MHIAELDHRPIVDGAWLAQRIGKLTASRMDDAMAFTKKGEPTAARKKYMIDIVAERMTDIAIPHYVTSAMEHGLEFEQSAKHAYTVATGNKIQQGVFVDHPTIEWVGATPDSFVDPDGLLETKCPTTPTHLAWIVAGIVPMEYRPQMIMQLMCTVRKWCDFVSFDPRMPDGKRLFIRRYTPTAEELKTVESAAIQFLAEVEQLFEQVTTADMT